MIDKDTLVFGFILGGLWGLLTGAALLSCINGSPLDKTPSNFIVNNISPSEDQCRYEFTINTIDFQIKDDCGIHVIGDTVYTRTK